MITVQVRKGLAYFVLECLGVKRWWRFVVLIVGLESLIGCASSRYQYGRMDSYHSSPELAAIQGDQIERGQRRPVLDGIGWVVGIPSKIILWDHRVDNHSVSPETELALCKYLADNELDHVKVRINQYAPGEEWKRLVANKSVGAGWRYTLGTLSWVGYTILPGRVFGGDNYNPFTNTIHIYSDAPALALHEGGHAKDFSQRSLPGTYAAVYALVPFAPLYHEAVATNDALSYLHIEGSEEDEKEAYRLLYPAYGTYLGQAVGGPLIPIVGGHIAGRVQGSRVAKVRRDDREQVAEVRKRHLRYVAARDKEAGKLPDSEISPRSGVTANAMVVDSESSAVERPSSRSRKNLKNVEPTGPSEEEIQRTGHATPPEQDNANSSQLP